MSHNNLENNNATITITFLREGKFDVLNYFICCKDCLKLMKYRVNKSLLQIQQQKWRLVNKTLS